MITCSSPSLRRSGFFKNDPPYCAMLTRHWKEEISSNILSSEERFRQKLLDTKTQKVRMSNPVPRIRPNLNYSGSRSGYSISGSKVSNCYIWIKNKFISIRNICCISMMNNGRVTGLPFFSLIFKNNI